MHSKDSGSKEIVVTLNNPSHRIMSASRPPSQLDSNLANAQMLKGKDALERQVILQNIGPINMKSYH